MTFDAFLAQRSATDRDALEAYDGETFHGLKDNERHMAEAMLIKDMQAGRHKAYRGLALLGSVMAIEALKGVFDQVHVPSNAHVRLCDALYLATRDDAYLYALRDDVTCEQPSLARDVIVVLASHAPSAGVLKEAAHVIRQHYLDEATRALAVSTLMVCCGYPALSDDLSPERLRCERALMAATPTTWSRVTEDIITLARQRGYALPCVPF